MNHIAAGEYMAVISGLLDEWNAKGNIEALEYDLLLDRIKSLYEEVKFGHCNKADGPVVNGKVVLSPETDRSRAEGIFGRAIGNCGNNIPSVQENSVSALYGNDNQLLKKKSSDVLCEAAKKGGADAESTPGLENHITERTGERAMVSQPVISSSANTVKQVLGEVIGNNGPTIADKVNVSPLDVATKLGHEKRTSLRGSIGINDKYMFVRDLFGGDQAAYEEGIETLDNFTSIEDAMIYIHDTYTWNADNQAALALCAMLSSKLM